MLQDGTVLHLARRDQVVALQHLPPVVHEPLVGHCAGVHSEGDRLPTNRALGVDGHAVAILEPGNPVEYDARAVLRVVEQLGDVPDVLLGVRAAYHAQLARSLDQAEPLAQPIPPRALQAGGRVDHRFARHRHSRTQ